MSNCNCIKEFKIPVFEKDFMNEQKSDRKMYIENCDLTATKLLGKCSLRHQQYPTLPQATLEKSQAASNFTVLASQLKISQISIKSQKTPLTQNLFSPVTNTNH